MIKITKIERASNKSPKSGDLNFLIFTLKGQAERFDKVYKAKYKWYDSFGERIFKDTSAKMYIEFLSAITKYEREQEEETEKEMNDRMKEIILAQK
tara:strand:+ start:162 stop:449 length:288 start_codon:yes stop_codon:yes gene_type:complete